MAELALLAGVAFLVGFLTCAAWVHFGEPKPDTSRPRQVVHEFHVTTWEWPRWRSR